MYINREYIRIVIACIYIRYDITRILLQRFRREISYIYFLFILVTRKKSFNERERESLHVVSIFFLVPLVNISVVEGKGIELPCNITAPGHDTLDMVFWFKDAEGPPLYT